MPNLHSLVRKVSGLLPFLLVAAFAACTEEKIVEVEREPFNPPADAASGFLGYYTVSEQSTTCANCHVDYQGPWEETAHAEAYNTLKANAGNQPFCFSCHTVTERGNVATGTVGWDKVQDSTYRDVQCESCHGPGQKHVEGPSTTKPRPLLGVGLRTVYNNGLYTVEKTADTANACGACHDGEHHPYLEQWGESRHALTRINYANRIGCGTQCHEGRGRLESWGENVSWKEGSLNPQKLTTGTVPFDANITPITCAVCHDPHDATNEGQLRWPINSPDETVNLCIKCHLNRATAAPPTASSPHGAQGAMFLGFAGYRPPGFVYDTARIYGSHASPTANPSLCAGCHVQKQTINDPSGKFQLQSVGHLFKPIPCLDSQGNPSEDHSCAYTSTARSWNSCTRSGCHANASVAATVFNSTKAEVRLLTDVLWKNVGGASCGGGTGPCLDPAPTDAGYLPKLKAKYPALWQGTELSEAEGCEFNTRLTGGYENAGHPDGSYGTHNAFLYRALLTACISYLQAKYPGDLPAPPAQVQEILDRWNAPVMGNAALIARVPLPRFDR